MLEYNIGVLILVFTLFLPTTIIMGLIYILSIKPFDRKWGNKIMNLCRDNGRRYFAVDFDGSCHNYRVSIIKKIPSVKIRRYSCWYWINGYS